MRLPPRARLGNVLAAALVLVGGSLAPRAAGAQGQSVDVVIEVPGIGQPRATGVYFFKLAIVDGDGNTIWSHDGSSAGGSEPRTSVPLPVENGSVAVTLGEPAGSGLLPLPPDLLQREDLSLRVWASNGSPVYLRLRDRPLRGKGYAAAAETARNAERLEGRRAADFEIAGAVYRHEQQHAHAPAGTPVGGRLYHGRADLGAGRELDLHFELAATPTRLLLTLHGSPLVGPPGPGDLRLETRRADNPAAGASVVVVEHRGAGWLAGIREAYDFCNTCFKRKLPGETEVRLDGAPFDAWKAGRREVAPDAATGRVDHLAPLGLVRFERSLQVTTRNPGTDDATGSTVVWYYAARADAPGAPGALQVLLDGGDVTPALVALPEAARSFRSASGRLVASRYDGPPPPADALDAGRFLARRADAVWLVRGAEASATAGAEGASLVLVGEAQLAAGERRFVLSSTAPAALELLVEGAWRRAAQLVAAGSAEAGLVLPAAGWYPLRALAAAPSGELALDFAVDGRPPRLRSAPLLGGEGGAVWSAGPLDLVEAGVPLLPGAHVLTLRERGGRGGHLEYALVVE